MRAPIALVACALGGCPATTGGVERTAPAPAIEAANAPDCGAPPARPDDGGPGERLGAPAGAIACGGVMCRASEDYCCEAPDRKSRACRPRGELAAPDDVTCHGRRWACDDSGDCAPDEVCCGDVYFGSRCVAAARSKAQHACAEGELCTGDSCRFADDRCDEGVCAKRLPALACGTAVCGADAPLCCVEGPLAYCTAHGGCAGGVGTLVFACRDERDCGVGQRCCAGPGGASCAGDCRNDLPTCRSDADCRGVAVPGAEGDLRATSCVADARLGLRHCQLPALARSPR